MVAFLVLQLLNLADVVLTQVAVGSGAALEANPVVRAIGMPGKIALVFAAGWVLMVVRPKVLVIPIAALGAVVVYSGLGLLVF